MELNTKKIHKRIIFRIRERLSSVRSCVEDSINSYVCTAKNALTSCAESHGTNGLERSLLSASTSSTALPIAPDCRQHR